MTGVIPFSLIGKSLPAATRKRKPDGGGGRRKPVTRKIRKRKPAKERT